MSTTEKRTDFNSSVNQTIKSSFIGKHVYSNVNTLVEYIINKFDSDAPFSIDDIENLYSYPEYNGTYASFAGGTEEERDEEIERLENLFEEDGTDSDLLQDEINELKDLESEPAEIFEWWAVSEFLYKKLQGKGYPVLDAGSCKVWGRTTTGQAILLDNIISVICSEMQILEGQENSWENHK